MWLSESLHIKPQDDIPALCSARSSLLSASQRRSGVGSDRFLTKAPFCSSCWCEWGGLGPFFFFWQHHNLRQLAEHCELLMWVYFTFSVRLIRSTSAFMLAGYTQEIDRSQSNADAGKRCSCCRWQIPGQIQTFYNSKNKCLCFIWVIHALNVSSWGRERHTRELTSVFLYSVNSG